MAAKCPTCGQSMTTIRMGTDLATIMKTVGVECYLGQDHNYYLTRGAGQVARTAIDQALAAGLIKPKWDDAPHLEYWRAA